MDPFGVMFLPFVAQESKWMVLDLSQQLAQLRHLLMCVGHADFDSPTIRDDIRRLRRKCVELCRGTKVKLWPHIQSTRSSSDELFKQFLHLAASIELFMTELKKLYSLTKSFPMHSDVNTNSADLISYKSEGVEDTLDNAVDSNVHKDELLNIDKDTRLIVELFNEIQDKIPKVIITDDDLYEGYNANKRSRRKQRNLNKCTIMCCVCKEYYI